MLLRRDKGSQLTHDEVDDNFEELEAEAAAAQASADAAIPKATIVAKGDIVVGSAPGTPAALPVGADGTMPMARASAAAGFVYASPFRKNAIINGGFTVNQRVYASAAVLAAGAYGHDRWKGGAGGGNYTFAQLAHNTTITIAAGKSLIQVVEDKNVVGGAYMLSWTGTAQARAGVNTATPAGAYAASPLVIAGQTAGTVMSVEFNEGTLGKVQLEAGSVATEFEQRTSHDELALCQRYCQVIDGVLTTSGADGANQHWCTLPTTMRTAPTIAITGNGGSGGSFVALGASSLRQDANNTVFSGVTIQLSAEL